MDEKTTATDKRKNNRRPVGTPTTEPSTLCVRVRTASGQTQAQLAHDIGATEKTVWRYEKNSIIPLSGPKRAALEAKARELKVPIKESV